MDENVAVAPTDVAATSTESTQSAESTEGVAQPTSIAQPEIEDASSAPTAPDSSVGTAPQPDAPAQATAEQATTQLEAHRSQTMTEMAAAGLLTPEDVEYYQEEGLDRWQQDWDGWLGKLYQEWQTEMTPAAGDEPPANTEDRAQKAGRFVEKYFDKLSPERRQELADKLNPIIDEIAARKNYDNPQDVTMAEVLEEMENEETEKLVSRGVDEQAARERARKRMEYVKQGFKFVLAKAGAYTEDVLASSSAATFIDNFFLYNSRGQSGGAAGSLETGANQERVSLAQIEQHLADKDKTIDALQRIYLKSRNTINLSGWPDSLKDVGNAEGVTLEQIHQAISEVYALLQSTQEAPVMKVVVTQGLAHSITGDAAKAERMSIDPEAFKLFENLHYNFDKHATTNRWNDQAKTS